jgi:hypothetical protein
MHAQSTSQANLVRTHFTLAASTGRPGYERLTGESPLVHVAALPGAQTVPVVQPYYLPLPSRLDLLTVNGSATVATVRSQTPVRTTTSQPSR